MDFVGQRNAEHLLMAIVLLFAVAGFVVGYAMQDFSMMVKINGVGLGLSLVAVLPDWPWFNRNPWTWLPALNPDPKATDKKK